MPPIAGNVPQSFVSLWSWDNAKGRMLFYSPALEAQGPEAADLVVKGMDGAISARTVTYDFARLMEGATELKTSEFGDTIIQGM